MSRVISLLLPLIAACSAPSGEQVWIDTDGDGLHDATEHGLGLDPQVADTDGDGFDDGEEVHGNTDALDASDHPYAGGWPIDACRDDLVATGDAPGQVTEDFALLDQHGETVRLHDFCGKEVLLLSSAMWCEICRVEAPRMSETYAALKDRGFVLITLLGETVTGETPKKRDLKDWARNHGIDHPVLADADWAVSRRWIGPDLYLPTQHLLAPGAVVIEGDSYFAESDLEEHLP